MIILGAVLIVLIIYNLDPLLSEPYFKKGQSREGAGEQLSVRRARPALGGDLAHAPSNPPWIGAHFCWPIANDHRVSRDRLLGPSKHSGTRLQSLRGVLARNGRSCAKARVAPFSKIVWGCHSRLTVAF